MPDPRIPHAYILIRTDLPLADQLVQCAHAAMEAAWRFPRPDTPVFLVVLGVPSQDALQSAQRRASRVEIDTVGFYEPDHAFGLTAFCTAPLIGEAQRHFRRYPLWNRRAE